MSTLLSGCLVHPINRVESQPNSLLLSDSCIILEDRLENVTVLFPSGLVLFASRDMIEDRKQFMNNNLYECRYCWGKYQYQNQLLTVFKPLATGYLNLPGSYPIQQLKYQITNGNIANLSDYNNSIIMQKAKLLINPDHAWLASKSLR